jgi:hypothetical protein
LKKKISIYGEAVLLLKKIETVSHFFFFKKGMARYQDTELKINVSALKQLLHMSDETKSVFPGNVIRRHGTFIPSNNSLYPSGKKCAIGSRTVADRKYPQNNLPQTHTSFRRSSRSKLHPYNNTEQTRQARVQVSDTPEAQGLFSQTGLVTASPISLHKQQSTNEPEIILHPRHIRPLQPIAAELRWDFIKSGTMMYVIKRGTGYEKEIIGIVIVISIITATRIAVTILAESSQYPLPVEDEEHGISFFHPDDLATISDIYSSDPSFALPSDGIEILPTASHEMSPVMQFECESQPSLPDIPEPPDSTRDILRTKFRIDDLAKMDSILSQIYAISASFDYHRWANITPQYELPHKIICIIEKYLRGTIVLDPKVDTLYIDLARTLSS